jgi:sterol desaturase/sphingolipid hydroxylase (fatty acid hydroxylase superfamily)
VAPVPLDAELAFVIVGTVLVHEMLYVAMNTFFYLCDSRGWLATYKLPRTPRMAIPPGLLRDTLLDAFFGHVIFQPIGLYYLFALVRPQGAPSLLLAPNAPLPSVWQLHLLFLGANFTNEFLFYFIHRLFHESSTLYRMFHKQHHKYVGTIGFASEYAHFVEQLAANDFPTFAFCFLWGTHPLVWFVFLSWRLSETYETHSGYDFRQTWLGKIGLLNGRQVERNTRKDELPLCELSVCSG